MSCCLLSLVASGLVVLYFSIIHMRIGAAASSRGK
jgi:hypothetical protein